jgi:hypothetical protein
MPTSGAASSQLQSPPAICPHHFARPSQLTPFVLLPTASPCLTLPSGAPRWLTPPLRNPRQHHTVHMRNQGDAMQGEMARPGARSTTRSPSAITRALQGASGQPPIACHPRLPAGLRPAARLALISCLPGASPRLALFDIPRRRICAATGPVGASGGLPRTRIHTLAFCGPGGRKNWTDHETCGKLRYACPSARSSPHLALWSAAPFCVPPPHVRRFPPHPAGVRKSKAAAHCGMLGRLLQSQAICAAASRTRAVAACILSPTRCRAAAHASSGGAAGTRKGARW